MHGVILFMNLLCNDKEAMTGIYEVDHSTNSINTLHFCGYFLLSIFRGTDTHTLVIPIQKSLARYFLS